MRLPELVGGASGLGWVAAKAVLMFAVAVVGLRLGERRTLAQLGAFDFAVAVAIGAIIGRTVTASSASFATGAVGLVTLLVVHRLVAFARRHSRIARLVDHPPRVLVARGQIQDRELSRAGLTAADVSALLRQQGVDDLGQVGYLLYETRGATTLVRADRDPGALMRDGLSAAGYRDTAGPAEPKARQQPPRMRPDDGIHDSSSRTRQLSTAVISGQALRAAADAAWSAASEVDSAVSTLDDVGWQRKAEGRPVSCSTAADGKDRL